MELSQSTLFDIMYTSGHYVHHYTLCTPLDSGVFLDLFLGLFFLSYLYGIPYSFESTICNFRHKNLHKNQETVQTVASK